MGMKILIINIYYS